jgi:hypothetical protein
MIGSSFAAGAVVINIVAEPGHAHLLESQAFVARSPGNCAPIAMLDFINALGARHFHYI